MTSRARSGRRREALLSSAKALFLAHGYEGTSLEMVIAEAGGSRRTIYECFGNKEGLFLATVEEVVDSLVRTVTITDQAGVSIERALIESGRAFVSALCVPDTVALFRMVVCEATRFPQVGALFFERGPDQAYASVARYLEGKQAEGRLQVEDADLAARQLLEMMKGHLHLQAMLYPGFRPSSAQIERHVEQAVMSFLYGICRASSPDDPASRWGGPLDPRPSQSAE